MLNQSVSCRAAYLAPSAPLRLAIQTPHGFVLVLANVASASLDFDFFEFVIIDGRIDGGAAVQLRRGRLIVHVDVDDPRLDVVMDAQVARCTKRAICRRVENTTGSL